MTLVSRLIRNAFLYSPLEVKHAGGIDPTCPWVLNVLAALWSLWIIYGGLRVLAPARAALTTVVVAVLTLGLLSWSLL